MPEGVPEERTERAVPPTERETAMSTERITYAADVGSVRSGNFAWARISDGEPSASGSGTQALDELRRKIRADVERDEAAVSVGFEAPLFIPLRDASPTLTRARGPFEHSSFAGGPGAAVLVTGLTQLAYVLAELEDIATSDHRDAGDPGRLYVWEAFVSGSAGDAPVCPLDTVDHPVHECDALVVAKAAHAWLTDPAASDNVRTPEDFVECDRGLDLVRAVTRHPAVADVSDWHVRIVQLSKPTPH